MKRAAPIIAGAAVLALANVALAEEANLASADGPVLLTDAQMDGVTAGTAAVAAAVNNVTILVAGALGQGGGFAFATISADVVAIAGPDPSFQLAAFATVP